MRDSRDQTGERLGPYHLDKRYEDLDEPGGQLYAAHHVETGRPALVLVPGFADRWAPRGDWSARVTSQSSPPFVATELESPPPPTARALGDLDLTFIRMAGGIACVEDREDANADFTQPSRLRTSGRREGGGRGWQHARTGVLATMVLVLMAVVLWSRPPHTPERAESTYWLDQGDGASAISYPMPEAAFPEQLKPPCADYVEIHGGCWIQTKHDAPCLKGTAEYEGKCYVPVREKKPEPRSLKH